MFRLYLCALFLVPGSLAQEHPAFEVVSIKPKPDRNINLPFRMGPGDFSMRGMLRHFVLNAYDVEAYQVAGIPAWAQDEWFDIQAKPAGQSNARQIRVMLQSLLADRFGLKLHHETRVMAGYILSVDRNGPKLPAPKTGMPPDASGTVQIGGGLIWGRASSIKNLARGLTIELSRPVVDRTGIAGNYDFKLTFDEANDELKSRQGGDPANDDTMGSVFSAVHELGLRLEAAKVPIDVLVIDSAEPPSAN